MESLAVGELKKSDPMEEFEFYDAEGDLDIDIYESPAKEAPKKTRNMFGLIFSALCAIAEQKGLTPSMPSKITMAATAVGAVTGTLLGGPPGLAVGLLTGAVMAIRNSPKRSPAGKGEPTKSSVRQIFGQMTLQQKKELIKELIICFKQSNVRCLIFEMMKNETVRNTAMEILSGFLKKKMGISLINSL